MVEASHKMIPNSLLRDMLVGVQAPAQPELLQALKQQYRYNYFEPPGEISLETYVAIMEYLRQKIYPAESSEEGFFQLGLASLEGHFQSPVGKINKVAARMLSIEKASALYLKTQRYNYPFGKHELEKLEKGYLRYCRCGVPTPPDFTRGVLSYLVQLTGGKQVKVSCQSVDPETIIYEARWE